MTRRTRAFAIVAVTLVAGATATGAGASPDAEPRVVILSGSDAGAHRQVVEGFRGLLAKRGVKTPQFPPDPNSQTANDPAGASIILTVGGASTDWVLKHVSAIPVVGCAIPHPDSVSNSANATGVTLQFDLRTELDWLRRFLPDARRVGVLYHTADNAARVEAAQSIGRDLGLEVVGYPIAAPAEIPPVLESATGEVDVLWGISDPTVLSPQTANAVLLASFRHRIPFIGLSAEWVEAGALYALQRDFRALGRQCGEVALSVLGGAKPGAVPVAGPDASTYSVNLRTARLLGLDLPEELVAGAAAVFPAEEDPRQ